MYDFQYLKWGKTLGSAIKTLHAHWTFVYSHSYTQTHRHTERKGQMNNFIRDVTRIGKPDTREKKCVRTKRIPKTPKNTQSTFLIYIQFHFYFVLSIWLTKHMHTWIHTRTRSLCLILCLAVCLRTHTFILSFFRRASFHSLLFAARVRFCVSFVSSVWVLCVCVCECTSVHCILVSMDFFLLVTNTHRF